MTRTDLPDTTLGRDPALTDAYTRLSGSLAPPLDLTGALGAAITRRRRRRRAGVAAGGALALALVGGTLALTTGGTEPETAPDPAGQGGLNTVVVTRDDGTRLGFGPVELTCEKAGKLGQRLTATSPLVTAPGDDETLLEPLLHISVLVDDVELRRPYELPFEGNSAGGDVSSDTWSFHYFAAVPSSVPDQRANEIVSAAPGSSGTVRFDAATCGAVPSLDVTIDAILGSEVEQAAYPISGRLALP